MGRQTLQDQMTGQRTYTPGKSLLGLDLADRETVRLNSPILSNHPPNLPLKPPETSKEVKCIYLLFLFFCTLQVRRWIKSPMVSVDKHQSPSLKYTGPSVVHIPPGEADFEPALCQTCLGDHAFQRGVPPQEKESCSWESQSGGEVSWFLLGIYSPKRILGLRFSCICIIACQNIFLLMSIYKASEEDIELWPSLAHSINFLKYIFKFILLYFIFQLSLTPNIIFY